MLLSSQSYRQNDKFSIKRQTSLFRYLQEIGYTDTIIDVRSARVRSLLGLQSHAQENEADAAQSALVQMNGDISGKRGADQGKARYQNQVIKAVYANYFYVTSVIFSN